MDDMTQMIIAKLDRLEGKIDNMMSNGCAKVMSHEEVVKNQRDIFNRLGIVERAQAEGKGKLAVACAVLGAFVAFGLQWLGKHL